MVVKDAYKGISSKLFKAQLAIIIIMGSIQV